LTKTQLIYSVSCFHFGGLGALFVGAKPQKPPRGGGTERPLFQSGIGTVNQWKLSQTGRIYDKASD